MHRTDTSARATIVANRAVIVLEATMPTLIDIPEPATPSQLAPADTAVCGPRMEGNAAPFAASPAGRVLFSDSLLLSSSSERQRRGWATTFSFAFECMVVAFLLILPLMFTAALPTQQLLTLLVAPAPPPPPPPPPAAVPIAKVAQTDILNSGQLRTPTRIPRKVEMIREEEAPPPAIAGGVIGGVPGGIPGGQLGGVIGGIIAPSPKSQPTLPKLEPVKRVRVSQGITLGMVLKKVEPVYPKIALTAHISGVVLLHAIVSKQGTITELEVVSGHPVLIKSAMDAVKQWTYRPYLLNGEPVEVETYVTVTFQISD